MVSNYLELYVPYDLIGSIHHFHTHPYSASQVTEKNTKFGSGLDWKPLGPLREWNMVHHGAIHESLTDLWVHSVDVLISGTIWFNSLVEPEIARNAHQEATQVNVVDVEEHSIQR